MRGLRIRVLGVIVLVAVAVIVTDHQSRPISAGSPTSIFISPAGATIGTGDSVTIDVVAEAPADGLGRWSLRIMFDEAAVDAVRCTYLTISVCNPSNALGTASLVGYSAEGLTGTQALGRIVFAAIGPSGSQSLLTIEVLEFTDINGSSVAPIVSGGAIDVQGHGTHGIIRGVVFNDEDADGTQDTGDGGLFFREIFLSQEFRLGDYASDTFGRYTFSDLEAGDYSLTVFPSVEIPAECAETPPGFDPLLLLGCIGGGIIPWRSTTPDHVGVTVGAGSVNRIDFGAKRVDVQSIFGRTLLQDNYPQEGTLIEALVNGQQCGATTTGPSGVFGQFFIFGDGERPGCARPGDVVRFMVGGMPTAEEFIWEENGWHFGPRQFGLTAIGDYAWYWVEEAFNPAAVEMTVTASVGGAPCGETVITQTSEGFSPRTPPIGFSRLLVPSDAVRTGCGHAGTTVTFSFGRLTATSMWEPGLHRLQLPLDQIEPTPTPSPKPTPTVAPTQTAEPSAVPTSRPSVAPTPAALPFSGGRQGVSAIHYLVTVVILAAAALTSVGSVAVWHRWRKEV